nr:BTB POZ domain-containing protein [Megavirus caiporensis]
MDFSKIFESEKLSDIELILIDKNNNKKCLKLHKVILCADLHFSKKCLIISRKKINLQLF